MSWADFYLLCFLFGFFFSVVALVSGHFHLDFHHGDGQFHVAHHGGHIGHHGHVHAGQGHPLQGGQAQGHANLSPFNMGTLAAFLAWFGGTGYLATHYYRVWFLSALGLSVVGGIVGSMIVFLFLSRVLMREPEEMDAAAYDMIGVLGQVSGPIRAEGIGEVLYSREGCRRAVPARSEEGVPIPSGVEVVVTRYENGIAYVRRWDEMTGAATEV